MQNNSNETQEQIKQNIRNKLSRYFGTSPEEATDDQMYKAVLYTIRDLMAEKNAEFDKEVKRTGSKRVYYMCMEFLIGPSLKNNLLNLGIYSDYSQVLKDFGFSIERFIKTESDPGLGNGGLGRLAACFMDALTSLDYPAYGYSLCYEYGLFKQKIIDGEQVELPDVWLPTGEQWLVPRNDLRFIVRFGGTYKENWQNNAMYIEYEGCDEVEAVPVDMLISGGDSRAVNVLRLWRAKDVSSFDMKAFSQGQYVKAMEETTNAQVISKVLYPSDNHYEGKMLRLTQQYFLVSASLQNILNDHLEQYGTLDNLPDKVAIHINDTHPALCVPELMRILLDECAYSWDRAWDIVTRTLSYTNHTVMPEALETWREDIFKLRLPRIYAIICEINRRFCVKLWEFYPGQWDKIARMSLIENGRVKMANLSIVGSHCVNGVSRLHSQILKETIFNDFYTMEPEKFTNVTNGIAHRRWLCYSNPGLCKLLDETIGSDYRKHPEVLEDFAKFSTDPSVLSSLEKIKRENKERFIKYLKGKTQYLPDPDSLFDVQIKRMHEYKRQLLNVLRILSIYAELLENPDLEMRPQTFIFGAKAASGYYMAKQTIKLITHIGAEIDKNPKIREKLRVIFMENYSVSNAEILIPSADISEQISLAGKEASGTGNMKLMINGAVTIGTLDGANVEMHEAVGDDNIFIFGMKAHEVEQVWKDGYKSSVYYNDSNKLKKVIELLNKGFNGQSFTEFTEYLLFGQGISDPYMCFADFGSYITVHDKMNEAYEDRTRWLRMSATNIAKAGRFAADRAVTDYAEGIWNTKPVQ